MAERGESSNGNDEVFGQIKATLCQPCLNKDKQTKAEKFCSTCEEFQCLDCLKVHYTYAYMKGHILVNVNEAKKAQSSYDMKGLDQCNMHQKPIEFVCESENQLCCSMCAIDIHRKCKSVVDIQKLVGRSVSKSSSLKVKLEKAKQMAEVIINGIATSKEKLDEDVKEIPVMIRRMRDEVIKMFDELEIAVVKKAESLRVETLQKLEKKQSLSEKYLANIQSCLEITDCVYQNRTLVQQFIVEHKMQEEVNTLHAKVVAECRTSETVTLKFEFDDKVKLPPLPITDYVPGNLHLMSHLSEVSMKLTPTISIKLKQNKDDEMEPLYTGIDFLPDGRLVAVDNKNKKFLVYNEKLEKVGSYQLTYFPKSVATVSEHEVAITSGGCKLEILRVNKSNDILSERTYNLVTGYDSICHKGDTHFVVGTLNYSIPVRILSFTGKEKDFDFNFPKKPYPNGTSACTFIKNSDKVVLSDRNEHTVYIYDIKTNTRVVVKDDQIKEPCGVAVGPSDTILVCSENTNTIVQISQTGRILSSYMVDMIHPRYICVSRDKSFLVVTSVCTGKRKLQKLRISF